MSPTSSNSAPVRAMGAHLRSAGTPGVIVIDVDPRGFDDLQVGFLSAFPYEHLARRRSAYFEEFLRSARWTWLVRFEGGTLEKEGALTGTRFVYREVAFEEVPVAPPPFHLYRRVD